MAIDNSQIEKIPFGMADITVGEDTDIINFNGKDSLQAEGAEVTITPQFEDIVVEDFGSGPVDQRLVGYEINVRIVAASSTIQVLQEAMSHSSTITDTAGGAVVGLMDSPIGTSMRSKAKPVRIHPRQMGTDNSLDMVIYKMASTSEYTRTFGNSQSSLEINYSAYPRDGMDANKPGNFYYIGPKDPNEVTP